MRAPGSINWHTYSAIVAGPHPWRMHRLTGFAFSHSSTMNIGGCPPSLMWGVAPQCQGGFRITVWYPSVVRCSSGHFTRSIVGGVCLAAGIVSSGTAIPISLTKPQSPRTNWSPDCVTFGDPDPPGPVLQFPHQMWWIASSKSSQLGNG